VSTDLEFSWAEPEDLLDLEAFQTACYDAGAWQRTPGRARWMYFDHPLGLHVALCRAAGRLVAACGHLPQPVEVDGRRVTAGFGVDFMVAPDHRRRGIGRRFLEMRLERFDLGLSTGQSPGMFALYRSAGATDLGPLRTAVFRRRPARGGPPRRALRDTVLWLCGLAAGGAPRDDLADTAADEPDATADGELRAWLRWRYGGPVYADYRAWSRGRTTARGRETEGLRIVTGARGQDRAGLLAALARSGPAVETRVVFAGTALADDLQQAGYRLGTAGSRLVAVTRDRELAGRLRPGGLEITADAADADLLRHPV